jgi:hypothetical protein
MRYLKLLTFVPPALGALALQAGIALAEDLSEFAGTWAFTPAGCRDYLNDKLANEARKRGVGLMIIRPSDIEWVTPATCEIANVRRSGDAREMDGKCELKGNEFAAPITVTTRGNNLISVLVDSSITGREALRYSRCSKAIKWKDEGN